MRIADGGAVLALGICLLAWFTVLAVSTLATIHLWRRSVGFRLWLAVALAFSLSPAIPALFRHFH